jgi:hypothetical protein
MDSIWSQHARLLHHIADVEAAIANMIASLRPGGALLVIEPDFLPVSIAESPEVGAFLGRLACVVARAWDQLSDWADTCASTCVARLNKHQRRSRNGDLQRRFLVGGLLD